MKVFNRTVAGAFAGGVASALMGASTMFAVDVLMPQHASAGYLCRETPGGPGNAQARLTGKVSTQQPERLLGELGRQPELLGERDLVRSEEQPLGAQRNASEQLLITT